MRYRRDIDGLRAFAVLPVLAFHTGLVSGGFVGVDVFFVISGFLIGSTMIDEMSHERFSLVNFYERRVRRIVPALIAVLLFTLVVGYAVLLPSEFSGLGKSGLAALMSLSNIYFWRQSGYFAAPSASIPLLHTWSLAVEEQFYIILPLFIFVGLRFTNGRLRTFLGISLLFSLFASIIGTVYFEKFSFYMLPTRAWELLLGVLVGTGIAPHPKQAWVRSMVGAIGLVLLTAPVFLYDPTTPFPGLAAAPPCIGAAMVIHAGLKEDHFIGRVLGFAPIRFIGLISYSLYLWHWPIIVFDGLGAFPWLPSGGPLHSAAIILVSIVLAALSWRFVEKPFRSKSDLFNRQRIFQMAGASAAVLAGLFLAVLAFRGLPYRFSDEVVRYASYIDYDSKVQFRDGVCFISPNYQFIDFKPNVCLHQDHSRPTVVLAGDSQAADLWYGLSAAFPDVNVQQVTAAGCRATVRFAVPTDRRCIDTFHFLYSDYLARRPRVSQLILAGRWTESDMGPLADTLSRAKALGVPVLLVGPAVQYDTALPRLLALAAQKHDLTGLDGHQLKDIRRLDAAMTDLARRKGVDYVSLLNVMCAPGGCVKVTPSAVPVQYDYGHFTSDGSLLIARRLRALGVLGNLGAEASSSPPARLHGVSRALPG